MSKLLLLFALVSLGCRYATGRWPWFWLGQGPAGEARLRAARSLLTVAPDASRSDINAAHRRLIATVHPDRGGTAAQVHAANAARDLLLAQCSHESE